MNILVLVPVTVKVVEGLLALKVFELHHHVGVDLGGGLHELVHELLLFTHGDALGTKTQVERIPEVVLVGGAAVEHDRQGLLWVDTGCGRVQGELADLVRVLLARPCQDLAAKRK